uniref:PB1 domain-containing protein n=1 Tax=Oryzias latipes TaxID=8090 RepID=A0A3P9H9U1_ORYLA
MAAQNFLLHVHISTDIVRKMTLSTRPESVDELKRMIQDKFKLDFDFSLSYEDPDFDGQLCSLVDIEELPQKAVLKIVRPESDTSSIASDDTIILPHAMTPERVDKWPQVFPMPTFSYEVELILSEGNSTYQRTGKSLKLTRGQKHDILEALAATMHSFKAYPNDKEVSVVAEALVTHHPCLKEPGSKTGWYGWKNSLKFKMGNYRAKLSRAGFQEVAVNSGKRSKNNPDRQAAHTGIKRPKRAELNYLPNFPRGEDATSLEQLRLQIIDEVKKTDKDHILITKLMQSTFALRRKEIISDDLPVADILERWPALKMESQVNLKKKKKKKKNLKNHFFAVLDQHTPRLQSIFRKKASRTGKVSDSREPDVVDTLLGLLAVGADPQNAMFHPVKIMVVLEGNTIIDVPTLADGFVILFALIYALHLAYPKTLVNTFDFIQKVLMGLEDDKLKPKVLSLKNDLLTEL